MIHNALKVFRQFHKMTQTEMAKELGISNSYLSEIESGKKSISYELLEKYSQILDIPVSSITFFSESIANESRFSKAVRVKSSKTLLNILEWGIKNGKVDITEEEKT